VIPTTADDAAHERYVTNIIKVYNDATESEYHEGAAWYAAARNVAAMIADGNVRAGAGVIAALSPQKAWGYNVKLATEAFEGDENEVKGNVRDACAKAERIMLGEDPLDVLPEDSKTWNFFRCIVDPTDEEAVVIDRHAHDVAVGETFGAKDRGLSSKRRYATLAHAYREAARRCHDIPQKVQAIVWTVQVNATAELPYRAGRKYST
jgi:hypothetical protein